MLGRRGIRIGFDARFAPFTVGTGIGGFEGLGADVMRAAADRVGLRIVGQDSGSFADVLDRARRGEVDVVVGMARNAQREAEFDAARKKLQRTEQLADRGNASEQTRDDDRARAEGARAAVSAAKAQSAASAAAITGSTRWSKRWPAIARP